MSGSPIRSRGHWKLSIRPSETDKWLDDIGFYRKRIARDSSSLFRAISESIYTSQRYFHKIREDCVSYMDSNRDISQGSVKGSIDLYLREMLKPSVWGGLTEARAMSHLYRRDIVIFEANKYSEKSIIGGHGNTIYLYYNSDTQHFDVVYTKAYINDSSLCQSIVYEVLYEGVFLMQDVFFAVDKMLYDKLPTHHVQFLMTQAFDLKESKFDEMDTIGTDDNNNMLQKCKHHASEVQKVTKDLLSIVVYNRKLIHLENICLLCLNLNSAKELLEHGIIPFPYKVAKALDPSIYRNIEYDVYIEKCKEIQFASRYDGTTLQVGVKCLCRLDRSQAPLHCHIQQMMVSGPCTVFVEELGEILTVDYDQLETLPREELQPWAPPYRLSRSYSQYLTVSQVLQQLGNISRKKSYKKGDSRSKRQYMKEEEEKNEMTLCEYGGLPDPIMATYHHVDFYNFVPFPVEATAYPLMVDCRSPAAADDKHDNPPPIVAPPAPQHAPQHAAPHAPPHAPPPATQHHSGPPHPPPHPPQHPPHGIHPSHVPGDNHHNQGPCGDMLPPPVLAGAPLPHMPHMPHPHYIHAGMGYTPVMCGGKVCWFPAPYKSLQLNGADLPMNDPITLRYYYNLGVDCAWANGMPPPRAYMPQELVQDMGQMSIREPPPEQKPGPPDNKHQNKGNGQRTMMGPRFKRNNYENNQNMNHNKTYNNNVPNKGGPHNNSNFRRGPEPPRPEEVVPLQLVPYPHPPHYYPEPDPAMMGNMGGYVNYEESVEYVQHYYSPHYPPPILNIPPPTLNNEHK